MKIVNSKSLASSAIAMLLLSGASLTTHAEGEHKHKHDTHGHEAPAYEAMTSEFGAYDPAMEASTVIEVQMTDELRFVPDVIRIKQGDVVEFTTRNEGQLLHEFVLGSAESLTEHAAMMLKFPNMEHEEPYMSHVAPGESGKMLWKFTQAGEFQFGCLIPGHFDAGMKGLVIVK